MQHQQARFGRVGEIENDRIVGFDGGAGDGLAGINDRVDQMPERAQFGRGGRRNRIRTLDDEQVHAPVVARVPEDWLKIARCRSGSLDRARRTQ